MWILALLTAPAALAADLRAEARWTPFGRADLVFVEEGRGSGVLVGEHDGIVRSSFQPALLWHSPASGWGIAGTLGVARLTTTTWSGEAWTQRHWGVARAEIEIRRDLPAWEGLYAVAGLHGDLPSARVSSNAFTEEETALADEDAWLERARIGGAGGHAGVGVEIPLRPHLWVGFRGDMRLHTGFLRTSEAQAVSRLLWSEGALVLGIGRPPTRE